MDYTERHQSGPRCLPWLIKPFVDPQAQFLLVDEKTCLEQSKIVVKLTALISIDAFVGARQMRWLRIGFPSLGSVKRALAPSSLRCIFSTRFASLRTHRVVC
jgi:hypothetical protein